MTARLKAAGLCAAALLIGVPAWAQDQSQRYAMKDVEDGILRLDTYTGTVSYCRRKADAWVCESAVDDRNRAERGNDASGRRECHAEKTYRRTRETVWNGSAKQFTATK